ncbi:RecQ family zinc-binding domain-containing protein, partial [Pseudomonas aeruginosa]|nr:RecQ family zinc-binding domain-containing protein [Pseudomonas aeruginosa]
MGAEHFRSIHKTPTGHSATRLHRSKRVAPLDSTSPAGPLQDIERHKLNAMGAFAEAQTCRRLVLLNYFGEGRQEPCGNCDICLDPPKQYDGLMDARKALSTIYR